MSKPALVTHEVEKILGRPAETFAEGGRRTVKTCSPISKGDKHMSDSTSTAVPQADEQVHDGGPEARHPDRAGDGADGARRKSGQPRSTPMTPFEHDGGLYVVAGYPGADWAANARAAGAGTLSARPQVATGQDRRTQHGGITARAAGFAVKVPVGVGFAKRAGLVRDGRPDEFADLAGQLTVFRFDPATSVVLVESDDCPAVVGTLGSKSRHRRFTCGVQRP